VKILVLHDRKGEKIALSLLEQAKKYAVAGEILCTEGEGEASLAKTLGAATHVLAVCSQAEASSVSWHAFIAGFASGAGLPLLLYGDEVPSLPPWFAKEPVRLRSGSDFAAWLDREVEDWTREHAAQQARETLLDRGIPVSVSSLERCIAEKNPEAIKLFLQAGFSPDTLNAAAVPLICLAARAGDREIVALLLKSGASVNLPAGDRWGSAIIDAALGKHADILKDLLAAGADANAKSKDGQSALIIAVGLNDESAVELLLRAGANVDDPDSLGVSARKYAALFNRPGMVKLFQTCAPPLSQDAGV
jgi:hypothetical protein